LFKLQPEKLKEYLENEVHIRRRLRKKHKKMKDSLEAHFERIESENIELKEDI
jgi:hypothetical protein